MPVTLTDEEFNSLRELVDISAKILKKFSTTGKVGRPLKSAPKKPDTTKMSKSQLKAHYMQDILNKKPGRNRG